MTTTKKKTAKKVAKKAKPQATPTVQHSNNPVMWIRIELKPGTIETDATIDPRFPRERIAEFLNNIIKAATTK